MERVKLERKIARTLFTKCGKEVEEAIENKNTSELAALVEKLQKHRDDLLRLQNSMMALWLDAENRDEAEFESDMETADSYEKRWFLLKQKSKELLAERESSQSQSERGTVKSADEAINRRGIKLPKFELPTFDGQIKNWLGFWSQFKKIHDDKTNLDDDDKMHYLIQAMEKGSSAKELVDSFPPCGENYQKALTQLRDRFAKDEIIIDYYVRELLQLVVSKNTCKYSTRALYDRIMTQILALESLGLTKDKFALFLFPLVESALPDDVLRAWNRSRIGLTEKKSSLDHLLEFVKLEVESEERIRVAHIGYGESSRNSFGTAACLTASTKTNVVETEKHVPKIEKNDTNRENCCVWCGKGFHTSSECKVAMAMKLEERKDYLKKNRVCFVCLKKGHQAKFCRSHPKCILCAKRHFTIMCGEMSKEKSLGDNRQELALSVKSDVGKTVLLQTLKVNISLNGKSTAVRALIDSGAQRTFIKSDIASFLDMKPIGEQSVSHSLFGGAITKKRAYNLYSFNVSSLDGSYKCQMTALEQPVLCGYIPKLQKGSIVFHSLKQKGIDVNDCLGDQTEICLLIGSDILGSLLTGRTERVDENLLAMETRLGWTLQGPAVGVYCSTSNALFTSLIDDVENFWRLESLGIKDEATVKNERMIEEEVYEFFKSTVRVNSEGRYEVKLPWKDSSKVLDSNYNLACKRLASTTKKVTRLGILSDYDNVFREWLQNDIIEEVVDDDSQAGHYMPHHAVIKADSLTTKIRPVFDASALDKNGYSLNSCLEKGSNLIELIPKLLIGFRKNKIGITADIKKAFLQISLYPSDRDFLKFLWWGDISEFPRVTKTYRHRRVVFGVTTSPYLLSATILHHLEKYENNTVTLLKGAFYVDNCVLSVASLQEMQTFIAEAKAIMLEGKFELRCWVTGPDLVDTDVETISVLGLIWNPRDDVIKCKLPSIRKESEGTITKRYLLSIAQSVYDPLGFLCPSTVVPKSIIQKCWVQNVDWDTELPIDLHRLAKRWLQQIDSLNICLIPRRLSDFDLSVSHNSIHVFCDASKLAYACCIFLRSEYENEVSVRMVMAKTRVAPTKAVTIPRIELLGALMASRLVCEVRESLQISCDEIYWTDSSVVLAWIKRGTGFNVFVNNRIKEIVSRTKVKDWRHIKGDMNPADLPSRGCSPQALFESKWWEGPQWLRECSENWPQSDEVGDKSEIMKEVKENTLLVQEEDLFSERLLYFSSFLKIVRMIGWCKRFIYNCSSECKTVGQLTADELRHAEKLIFKILQKEVFTTEKQKSIKLQLYRDDEDLLRVKSRLTFGGYADSFVLPILLPKGIIIERFVYYKHVEYLHAGAQTLLTNLRECYWILGLRKLVSKIIKECIVCKRFSAKACSAPVPPLPADRVQCTGPFEVTGIDFAGPLYLRGGEKCWIALFTCATYRAVHLELCSSLSTEEFLLALRRFLARRGHVRVIYSDNGSNFKGAANVIDWKEMEVKYGGKLAWRFIPPAAPWWGGFWERMVRTIKDILKRVLGKASLRFMELVTVLCEVENVVNSRPLTYVAGNSDTIQPLTPANFLLFSKTFNSPFEVELVDAQILSSRWRYLEKLCSDLKQRFRSEYLGLLVNRENKRQHVTVKAGDLVLVGHNDRRRMEWPLSLVVEVLEGADGNSRVARVRTASGEFLRAFPNIYPLELSYEDTQTQPYVKQSNIQQSPRQESVDSVKTRSGRSVKVPARFMF